MFKKKFILREEEKGTGGGSSTDVFTTQFTDEDDGDDFDLSKIGNNEQTKGKTPQEIEQEAETARLAQEEKDRIAEEEAENNKSKTPEEIKAEEDTQKLADEEKAKKNEGKTSEEIAEEEKKEKLANDKKLEKEKEKKDSETEKVITDLEEKLKEEGKTEKEIEEAIEAKREEILEEENKIDPFAGFEGDKINTSSQSKTPEINFDEFITDTELSIDEGVEIKSWDDLKKTVKSNLEKAKSTVDTSNFPPEAKMLWDNLVKNNNIQLTDFYRNDTIRSVDNFLNLSDEVKVKRVLAQELKDTVNQENLEDAINDSYVELTDDEKQIKIKEVNRNANSIKTKEFNKIILEKNKFIESENKRVEEQAKSERETLAKNIESMNEFMGFPITDNVKKIMAQEARNGNMQKFLDENAANAKISAYIATRLGKNFEEAYKKSITKSKTDAYAKGTETKTKQKHNISSAGRTTEKGRKSDQMSFSSDIFQEED
jgi:hypothetical protein